MQIDMIGSGSGKTEIHFGRNLEISNNRFYIFLRNLV